MSQSSRTGKVRVLLVENIHAIARDLFLQGGFEVETLKHALSPEALVEKLAEVDVLGVRSKTSIPAQVFERSPHLMAVGCFCVGTNHVDLEAAKRTGVAVFNAPFSNTRSVAEMTISNVVALSRQIGQRNVELHQGIWNKKSDGCFEVRGKTLGIVGYGNIGTQVSAMAEAMGMRVVFYDIQSKLPLGNAKPMPDLGHLLREADFVTLHVPATPLTQWMMGPDEIAQMKPGSYLLNASRGNVVVIEALAEALQQKKLAGAAIDVFPVEPEGNGPGFQTPLRGLPNVILTPHIGGATEEAQGNIGREVATALIRHLQNGSTEGAVNLPTVAAPSVSGGHRLLNLHRNVPGVLSEINQAVAGSGANILSQHLATDPEVGYLIMDFDRELPGKVLERIRGLSASMRTRLL
jgi:D-3-phosphoglycerate dehydrogenase